MEVELISGAELIGQGGVPDLRLAQRTLRAPEADPRSYFYHCKKYRREEEGREGGQREGSE